MKEKFASLDYETWVTEIKNAVTDESEQIKVLKALQLFEDMYPKTNVVKTAIEELSKAKLKTFDSLDDFLKCLEKVPGNKRTKKLTI